MRILVINYEFPPLGGGAGNVSAYIARHLSDQGVRIAVLTSHFRGLPQREVTDGYVVHRVPVLRRHVYRCSIHEMMSFVANSVIPSWRLARRFVPDLVHIHSGFPTGPLGYWLKKTLGIPYILTLHGGEVPGFLPEEIGTLHKILAPATRVVWNEASAVIAVSDGLRELSTRAVPSTNIGVIPNGVDCDLFSPPDGTKPPHSPVRLLFVGRVVRQKGLRYLLEALSHMSAKSPASQDWSLRIVGDGPMRTELEEQVADHGIDAEVEFTGWLPFEQIPNEMRSADLFVLPSIAEGMPLVLLQAMACGLPVLATEVPGSVDLVHGGRNGLLVPAKDPERLEAALNSLLSSESMRTRMGKRSREIALTMDWSRIAQAYYELYETVLTPSGGSGTPCGG